MKCERCDNLYELEELQGLPWGTVEGSALGGPGIKRFMMLCKDCMAKGIEYLEKESE